MSYIVGYGKSYASFGEISQGRISKNKDFLITLPIDIWSTCELHCIENNSLNRSVINCNYEKSRLVAERMLEFIDGDNKYEITVKFNSQIPVGKGLSSSTADMLATVRAFQEVFGIIISESFISNLFASIEPHDALHYYMCVVYDHRRGNLIRKLNYIPQYKILGIDGGGVVDTREYNNNLEFTQDDYSFYEITVADLTKAFELEDDEAIAKLATISTLRHFDKIKSPVIRDALTMLDNSRALGIVTAHSGTFVGLLFNKNEEISYIESIHKEFGLKYDYMLLNTLKIL